MTRKGRSPGGSAACCQRRKGGASGSAAAATDEFLGQYAAFGSVSMIGVQEHTGDFRADWEVFKRHATSEDIVPRGPFQYCPQ